MIKLIQTYNPPSAAETGPVKRYIIHKCVTIRHAKSGEKMGVDCLSIDGFECKPSCVDDASELSDQALVIQAKRILAVLSS